MAFSAGRPLTSRLGPRGPLAPREIGRSDSDLLNRLVQVALRPNSGYREHDAGPEPTHGFGPFLPLVRRSGCRGRNPPSGYSLRAGSQSLCQFNDRRPTSGGQNSNAGSFTACPTMMRNQRSLRQGFVAKQMACQLTADLNCNAKRHATFFGGRHRIQRDVRRPFYQEDGAARDLLTRGRRCQLLQCGS